jgi:hypothetical protein
LKIKKEKKISLVCHFFRLRGLGRFGFDNRLSLESFLSPSSFTRDADSVASSNNTGRSFLVKFGRDR